MCEEINIGQLKNEDFGANADEKAYLERCYGIAGCASEKIAKMCAMAGKADEEEIIKLSEIGKYFGICCQIRNDVLDLIPENVLKGRTKSMSKNPSRT